MGNVTYVAQRNVSNGHVKGVQYSLDFTASRLQRSSIVNNRTLTSLDNSTETLRYYTKVTWNITVNELEETDMPVWREFLDSVDGGESFDFDPYGTDASPDDVRACELESRNYSEIRIGTTDYYNLSFRVRER